MTAALFILAAYIVISSIEKQRAAPKPNLILILDKQVKENERLRKLLRRHGIDPDES